MLLHTSTTEVLLRGKAQYSWPPCTNQFRSAPFYIENVMDLFYKTSYLNEEVNCTKPSLLVSIPWFYYHCFDTLVIWTPGGYTHKTRQTCKLRNSKKKLIVHTCHKILLKSCSNCLLRFFAIICKLQTRKAMRNRPH